MKTSNHIYPYLKSYRWQSIFIKYFVTFLLVITIPFTTLTVGVFSFLSKNYVNNIHNSMNSSASSYMHSIENIFRNIDTNITLLTSNDYLLSYLVSSKDGTTDLYTFNVGQRVSELIRHSLLSNEYIYSVQIYNKATDYIASFDNTKTKNLNYIFDEYKKTNQPNCTLKLSIVDGTNTTIETITLYREIYLSSTSIGVMAVNINPSKMIKSVTGQSFDLLDNFVLFTDYGEILYSFSDNLPVEINEENIKTIKNSSTVISSQENSYAITIASNDLPYILSVCYSDNNSYAYFWILELLSILIILIISFILAYKLSLYFYNSLAGIMTILENSPNTKYKHETKDEINYLSGSILDIIQKNEQIEQELAEKTLSFKNSQMQALQMQINPHFIFNTLQFASTMSISILKKDTPVSQILSKLAELIHAVYQIDDYIIPLSQELQYAKNYLEIQSMRYDNSFTAEWDIDKCTLDSHVIKFTLQPILENAVTHGLMPINCEGIIRISAKKEDDTLVIKIANNGVGMSSEKLVELQNSLKLDELAIGKGKGIGLRNTQQRIQNVFGPDYGLFIDADDFGTTVTVKLPNCL